jgi:hypothetical protein
MRALDKDKWIEIVDHLCVTLVDLQLVQLYRKKAPRDHFFEYTYRALLNDLLMRIAHTVHICQEVASEFHIGQNAKSTLDEIIALFSKGNSKDRSALIFDDCGIGPFREKCLGHPLNPIKRLLGKQEYVISLKWETVESTFEKIKQFCDEVEAHYASQWKLSTWKQEVGGVEDCFERIVIGLGLGDKYDSLMRVVMCKGICKVSWDWQKREIIVMEDPPAT